MGSHKLGVINPSDPSAFLTEEQARQYAPADKVVFLEMSAGEVVLLHNWLLHASDINRTDFPIISKKLMRSPHVTQRGIDFKNLR